VQYFDDYYIINNGICKEEICFNKKRIKLYFS